MATQVVILRAVRDFVPHLARLKNVTTAFFNGLLGLSRTTGRRILRSRFSCAYGRTSARERFDRIVLTHSSASADSWS